jgi:regulator of replication initiation timing
MTPFWSAEMPKTVARSVDLEPLDRLEEKVKRLVNLVDRLKTEQAQSARDSERLARELDALRQRLADGESASAEAIALREEREVIRARVTDMLTALDALNL